MQKNCWLRLLKQHKLIQETQLKFYQESGVANPINLFLTFICTSIIIIPISYFYSLIITYFPLIYFNVVLVVVYGYIIALLSNIFAKVFKIRNKKKTLIITLLSALFAFYCQWVSYLYIILNENVTIFFEPNLYFKMFSLPFQNLQNILAINEFGSWEIFSTVFKGNILWVIWILEFSIILATSYFGFLKMSVNPFSEIDNKWYKKEVFNFDFEAIKLRKDFIKNYQENPFEAINNLESGNGIRYSNIYIYSSKSKNKILLSIDNIMVTERGKGKKDIEEILAPNYIDSNIAIQLKNKFKIKKSTFFDFFTELYS